MFDKDNSGKLSVQEIKNIFGGTEETWQKVISEVDANNDGEVDFEEFKYLMMDFQKEDKEAIKGGLYVETKTIAEKYNESSNISDNDKKENKKEEEKNEDKKDEKENKKK